MASQPVHAQHRFDRTPILVGKERPPGPPKNTKLGLLRSVGLGLITGAADDDPSAIGTYASAGAAFGPALLWVLPLVYPMMFTVVYLCGKVGQATGQGLFAIIRQHY